MIEQQDLSAMRRKMYLRIAGVLGTIEELLDQPNIVLEGGFARRAQHDPCECNLVDGEAAFGEMLMRIEDTVCELGHAQREYERSGLADQTLISDVEYAMDQSQALVADIKSAQEEWDRTSAMENEGKCAAKAEMDLLLKSQW